MLKFCLIQQVLSFYRVYFMGQTCPERQRKIQLCRLINYANYGCSPPPPPSYCKFEKLAFSFFFKYSCGSIEGRWHIFWFCSKSVGVQIILFLKSAFWRWLWGKGDQSSILLTLLTFSGEPNIFRCSLDCQKLVPFTTVSRGIYMLIFESMMVVLWFCN